MTSGARVGLRKTEHFLSTDGGNLRLGVEIIAVDNFVLCMKPGIKLLPI